MPLTQPQFAQQAFTFKLLIGNDLWSAKVDPDSLIADVNSKTWTKYWTVLRNTHGLGRTLGVHLYLRPWPELAVGGVAPVEYAMRFNNGVVNPDGSGFCGDIRYTSLKVQWGSLTGATIVDEVPHHGQSFASGHLTIAADPGDGTMHSFPPRWILERRGVIVPAGGNASTIRASIFDQASLDVSAAKAAFGPHKINLTKFAAFDTAAMAALCGDLETNIANGTQTSLAFENGDVLTNGQNAQVGPFLMEDYADGGAPAGYGIDMEPGWQADKNAVRFAMRQHELIMARQPVACYDFATGNPMSPKSWTSNHLSHTKPLGGETGGAYNQPELIAFMQSNGGGDDQNRYIVHNTAVCSYETTLKSYRQHDPAHLVRAWRCAALLAGYLDDAMAKDDIVMLARNARHYGWGDRSDEKATPDYPGAYIEPSLLYLKSRVDAAPHTGDAQLDRAFGHMLMVNAWAGFCGDAEASAWLQKALHVYTTSADGNGICQREYHTPYMPADVEGTQHFHTALTHVGAYVAAAALPNIDANAHTQLPAVAPVLWTWVNSVLLNGALPLEQRYDNNAVSGPPKWIGTHVDGGSEIMLSRSLSWGEDPAGPSGKNGFQEHSAAAAASCALALYALDAASAHAKTAVDACWGLGTPQANNVDKLADVNANTPMRDSSQWSRWLSAHALAYP